MTGPRRSSEEADLSSTAPTGMHELLAALAAD